MVSWRRPGRAGRRGRRGSDRRANPGAEAAAPVNPAQGRAHRRIRSIRPLDDNAGEPPTLVIETPRQPVASRPEMTIQANTPRHSMALLTAGESPRVRGHVGTTIRGRRAVEAASAGGIIGIIPTIRPVFRGAGPGIHRGGRAGQPKPAPGPLSVSLSLWADRPSLFLGRAHRRPCEPSWLPLPPGEGRGEGRGPTGGLEGRLGEDIAGRAMTLTPTLSRGEREPEGRLTPAQVDEKVTVGQPKGRGSQRKAGGSRTVGLHSSGGRGGPTIEGRFP